METQDLPNEKVRVKLSICPKCKGYVRSAVEHLMSAYSSDYFFEEAKKHNLDIRTFSLLEYREDKVKKCTC